METARRCPVEEQAEGRQGGVEQRAEDQQPERAKGGVHLRRASPTVAQNRAGPPRLTPQDPDGVTYEAFIRAPYQARGQAAGGLYQGSKRTPSNRRWSAPTWKAFSNSWLTSPTVTLSA